mgnify:CR=1 FL=1
MTRPTTPETARDHPPEVQTAVPTVDANLAVSAPNRPQTGPGLDGIVEGITPRSKGSSEGAGDDEGIGPLLGLELTSIENTGQKPAISEDSNRTHRRAPLLGTSTSQVLEIPRGSSKKRSPESICYPKLLRENGPSSGRISRKTMRGE